MYIMKEYASSALLIRFAPDSGFNLIGIKAIFQNYPVVAKNLRLEGTSASDPRRRRLIALRGLNRTRAHSFPQIQALPPAESQGSFRAPAGVKRAFRPQ